MYGSMRSEENGVPIGDTECARKVPRVMQVANEVSICFIVCLFVSYLFLFNRLHYWIRTQMKSNTIAT